MSDSGSARLAYQSDILSAVIGSCLGMSNVEDEGFTEGITKLQTGQGGAPVVADARGFRREVEAGVLRREDRGEVWMEPWFCVRESCGKPNRGGWGGVALPVGAPPGWSIPSRFC